MDFDDGPPPSEDQIHMMGMSIRISAGLSLFGSLLILFSYMLSRRLQTHMNVLVYWQTVATLVYSAVSLVGDASFSSSTICYLQGFFLNVFSLSTVFWTASFATHCLMAVKLHVPLSHLTSFLKYYHIVSWGLPFTMTGIAVSMEGFHDDGRHGPFFTQDYAACWISRRYEKSRFIFFYIPLALSCIYSIVVHAYIGVRMLRIKQTRGLVSRQAIIRYVRKTGAYLLVFYGVWGWGTGVRSAKQYVNRFFFLLNITSQKYRIVRLISDKTHLITVTFDQLFPLLLLHLVNRREMKYLDCCCWD